MTVLSQDFQAVPLDQLQPHPENPRRANTDIIEESISANGFYGALIVQKSTGYILAGNHRYRAALAAGLADLPVLWVDVDDDRARRILLTDNRTADVAGYDEEALLELLDDLAISTEALAGTGYDLDALEDLRAQLDSVDTLDPTNPNAEYAETPEQEAERAGREGSPSIHDAGLRELVLVYNLADHEEVVQLIGDARRALGPDTTSGEAVLAALRTATRHPEALADAT